MKIRSTLGSKALLTEDDVNSIYMNDKGYIYTRNGERELYCSQSKKYAEIIEESKEEFQIGKWYEAKKTKGLFIKAISKKTANVIWSIGTYQEVYSGSLNDNSFIERYKLLDDLSVIQKFLPYNHPDRFTIKEQDKPQISRYITITDSSSEDVFITKVLGFDEYEECRLRNSPVLGFKKRAYYKRNDTLYTTDYRTWRYSTEDEIEHLDACIKADKYVDVKPAIPTELKVGQWVKIIDEPEEGRPTHWCSNGEMDKYFGQWVEIRGIITDECLLRNDYIFNIEDDWVLKHSDYTEVRDTHPDTIYSWVDQHVQHMRDYPMTPEQSFKVPDLCKEETVSSHLILLDVKPVRVSKQFK